MLPSLSITELISNPTAQSSGAVQIAAVADLPSRFGQFQVVSFYSHQDGKEHAAFVRGDVRGGENIPVRLHSECLTGDAIGSLRCDCRDQLEAALGAIGQMEQGILLYLRQEGRGIGLTNKIRAYGLQDLGYDTVEANLALGFADDERDFGVAADMLRAMEVKSVQVLTNNPRKIAHLERHNIRVSGRIPLVMAPNPYNEFYLRTKANKSGHMIDFNVHLQEPMLIPLPAGLQPKQAVQSSQR
jgi:GTP cyclohydrolase II